MQAVLMFHSIDPSGSVLSMTEAQLDSLLGSILASGHRIVDLRTLLQGRGPRDSVALTFDDGVASLLNSAVPILARHKAPATLFVTTGYVGRDNRWPSQAAEAPMMPMLDWDGIRALAKAGWSIESHSVSHPDLRQCSDVDLQLELRQPIEVIGDEIGSRPEVFAYPYGYLDARVVAAVTRHYAGAVTTTFAPLPRGVWNRHRVPRLDTFYFRDRAIHRHFGGPAFRAYLAARGAGRRVAQHPGETALL